MRVRPLNSRNSHQPFEGKHLLRSSAGAIAMSLLLLVRWPSFAQTPSPATGTQSTPQRVSLDRIVAVANGDLILESDVDAEQRFATFQSLRSDTPNTREQLINRLIDRTLIEQQMRLQPQPPISDADVDAQLVELKKNIPACPTYHCDTEAGWEKLCADNGFTVQELRDRWRIRMEVLQFIEQRFRMGIRISPREIDDYYKNKLVPAYEKEHATPPAEPAISDRIHEILLQQQVSGLLDDWLKALRAQGNIRMMDSGGTTP